jgi:hypothetical protein
MVLFGIKRKKWIYFFRPARTVNGTIYLAGFPNSDQSENTSNQLEYVLNTRSKINAPCKTGLQDLILKKNREANCRYSIKQI